MIVGMVTLLKMRIMMVKGIKMVMMKMRMVDILILEVVRIKKRTLS